MSQVKLRHQITLRKVRQNVTSNWIALENIKAEIGLRQEQLNTSLEAYKGVVEEQKLGRRSTFEVLNLEQDLLQARISALTAEVALIRGSATLLESIGTLNNSLQATPVKSTGD